ncbi:MAG: hypothetical protein Q9187_001611 [Circinaria calcarea]
MIGKAPGANHTIEETQKIIDLLAVSEIPEDDFRFFLERWMPGTCEWLLSEKVFSTWLQQSATSGVFWLHGPPASGKSIMSAYLINHLKDAGIDCQYYFFRFGDQTKRSLNSLLRSLAFQIAEKSPEFKTALTRLSDDGLRIEKTDARTIWQRLFVSLLFKLEVDTPLYWIIDATDESDSPQSLIELLSGISSCKIPLRVLIVSRRSTSLSSAIHRLSNSVRLDDMSTENNSHDIHLYVEAEMQYMHGTPEFRSSVSQKVLNRASGNFLWVHLASKEILQCNTQNDIELALEELPAGMEPLYHRMEANVAKSNKATDVELAKRLLIWTICSRHPLGVEEFGQALQPESPILDLRHTISQLCGQFVVVDNKDRVVMIHQTAREYLTKTPNLRCSIDIANGHEALLSRCMLLLLDPALRPAIERSEHQQFVTYAATSWAYHLNLVYAGSDSSLTLLTRFFQGYSVLVWLHYLASSKQLRSLAFTSQVLARFVQKRRRLDPSKIPTLHRLQELETVERWATDLVKLLGKFGSSLFENPSSIYKLVPHFCPRSSAVNRQFAKETARGGLNITGVTNTSWDDSMARLSVGHGEEAQKVVASGRHFAVLTFNGIIVLWDAIAFEERYRLTHQEHVTGLCFSTNNEMIASCGIYSTKVWRVSSGRQLYNIPNPEGSKALCVLFAKDDTILLMGSDDRNVRTLSFCTIPAAWQILDSKILREQSTIDGTYRNSPCCMAFNASASQVAVAYRGFPLSVWAIENPRLISRCRRTISHRQRKMSNAWTGVDRVVWHPNGNEILGLYNDGCVFKWQPLQDENEELYANASEIACSPEGSIFATSNVDGNVKLYNYHHFALVYQLTWDNPVVDLTFSPDSGRFYDLRGSVCNVWEPNVLIRLSDTDERGSETASEAGSTTLASMASESRVELLEPIIALAVSDRTMYYCTGNDEGVVHIYDSLTGQKQELWRSSSLMTVHHLAWSTNADKLACAEAGGKISVCSLTTSALETKIAKRAATMIFNATIQVETGGISQILLDPSSRYLLITSQSSTQTWSLEESTVATFIMSKRPGVRQRWINHPLLQNRLLACDSTTLTAYQWDSLTELSSVDIDTTVASATGQLLQPEDFPGPPRRPSLGNPLTPSENTSSSVDKFMLTQDGDHLLLQTSENGPTRKPIKHLRIFPITTSLSSLDGPLSTPLPLQPLRLPPELLVRIEIPLGIIPKHRLVFLDRDYWICTWQISGTAPRAAAVAPTRHYFLPKDWINAESLTLCTIMKDGAFLYPRNGEVAVIRCDLEEDGLLQG